MSLISRWPITSWTRRHIGFTAGTAVLSFLGGSVVDKAAARKKRKKRHQKRCRKLGTTCISTGRKCCGELVCGEAVSVEHYCCRAENAACRADTDCCDGYGCFGLEGDAPFCKLA